jgi:hypothetical protein
MPLKTLLIDDEALARACLRRLVNQFKATFDSMGGLNCKQIVCPSAGIYSSAI